MMEAPSHEVRRLPRRETSAARDSGGYLLKVHRLPLSLLTVVIGFLLAIPLPVAAQTGVPQSLPVVALHIGKATLETQIAATSEEQERGLMFYTKLADNDGMIFLLGGPSHATFWMKNTLIPLSVAFIDKDGMILEIHDMLPASPDLPDNQIPTTNSVSNNVVFALETNIHWFALNGIKPGDKIDPPPATLEAQSKLDEFRKNLNPKNSL
jgi:uncharacterized membrane protein (UPF0127 family)